MSKKAIPLSPKTIECIKSHLVTHNITQEEFANQLKVTPRTLNNWLSGRTAIEFSKLERLVKILGVGLEDLFGENILQEYTFYQEAARVSFQFFPIGHLSVHNVYSFLSSFSLLCVILFLFYLLLFYQIIFLPLFDDTP